MSRAQVASHRPVSAAALMRQFRGFEVLQPRREGRIKLMPAQQHALELTLPLGTLVLTRDDCDWLKRQLRAWTGFTHLAQVRLPAMTATLSADDAAWVALAIAHFERELAIEDRRSEDRLHPHTFPVEA